MTGTPASEQLYVIVCIDRPGAGSVRLETRSAHLKFVRGATRVRLGGPFLDQSGEMIGSMLIVEAESMSDAEAFAEADPYKKAGLFASVDIRPWKQTVGPVPVNAS